ncbi:MAG: HTTM domain-containing protein [Methylococcaceae bacterium]|nr:HTTM domain-containing protein [Methylococcaceae bacterium]
MASIWHNFWFKPIDVRQYAILRIAFGFLSALYIAKLLPFADVHFSHAGWLIDFDHHGIPNWGSWSVFNLAIDPYYARQYCFGVFMVGIAAAIAMMLGWQTRVATFITWVVLVSLWNKNPLLLDGDDAVLKVMAFYLIFSPCGWAWSVDARTRHQPPFAAIWPLRLIQFQIALLYFVSGWVKFHSSEWLDGTVLQYVLIHPQYARFNLSALLHNDFFINLLVIITGFIRWWELLFPLLLLNRYLRWLSLLIGVLFHIGLFIFMTLRWFPVIMLALYPALLSSAEFIRLIEHYRRFTK